MRADTIHAHAVHEAGGALEPWEFTHEAPLAADDIEISVESCGVCGSDVANIDNAWARTAFPLVPGHEVVGRVHALGAGVATLKAGDRVGLGWFSRSCMTCEPCLSGDANMCRSVEATIMGRHGGFAERVRCAAAWATPIPDDLDASTAGPLFCAGATVFNALEQAGVRPTDRAAVVGVGGLGHLAVQFLRAWGCEVTAFVGDMAQDADARALGAHDVVDATSDAALRQRRTPFDFIIVTTGAAISWDAYARMLGRRGVLHVVGISGAPVSVDSGRMMNRQQRVMGTSVSGPAAAARMLRFCARHAIAPLVERFAMSDANDALARLRSGEARFRIVLDADF